MILPSIQLVPGFSWFGKNIGIKDATPDFGGIFSARTCKAAAVFTRNTMAGAPVLIGREHIADGRLNGVIVNSKNANVATASQGLHDSRTICRLVGQQLGVAPEMILPSSTGVIGRRLPMEVIAKGCAQVGQWFGSRHQHVQDFAHSIMTTDTRAKWVSGRVGKATVLGIAKGAGMIEPNMATMLCYFVSDADLDAAQLNPILGGAVNRSFNRISVDTDTSTSDTVVLLCNGLAGPVDAGEFAATLQEMAVYLARQIARDGEGATRLIELVVSGAQSQEQALLTAKSVINSPLVKTAIHGADPNWGRFVMAIGKVFQYRVELGELALYFGQGAERIRLDAAMLDREEVPLTHLSRLLRREVVHIEIVLGRGAYAERVWGCDLSARYVRINADYTS
jgi:glutamate N-acetyltransferase / amino-acid N-acetyltransferase